MKLHRAMLGLFSVMALATVVAGQDIPRGVNYKKAPDTVNAAAQSALETALAADTFPPDLFGDVTVCGPMLWKALKPTAEKVMLEAKPIVAMIQNPEPIVAVGQRILTPDQRQSFWRSFKSKYPNLSSARIRKAHGDEISFYWATIPFDIEEPFFTIETASERFVVQLKNKEGKTSLFWIDLVGDLRTLKP
jgi:hypothetical protein